jgi:hypothetical protein
MTSRSGLVERNLFRKTQKRTSHGSPWVMSDKNSRNPSWTLRCNSGRHLRNSILLYPCLDWCLLPKSNATCHKLKRMYPRSSPKSISVQAVLRNLLMTKMGWETHCMMVRARWMRETSRCSPLTRPFLQIRLGEIERASLSRWGKHITSIRVWSCERTSCKTMTATKSLTSEHRLWLVKLRVL